MEARHRKVEGRGTAAKGLADREDTGIRLRSVADGDNEGAHATVLAVDDQAGHDERDVVNAKGWVRGRHKPGPELGAECLVQKRRVDILGSFLSGSV